MTEVTEAVAIGARRCLDEQSSETKGSGWSAALSCDTVALLDHLGITVLDLARGRAQFHPVLEALGYESGYGDDHSCSWNKGDETELILMAPREVARGPHLHGRAGWQHLAFGMTSRTEVERLHAVALDAGWTSVRPPKEYPRFSDRYFASFVEDDSGIRIEFMHNPPREA